MRSFRTSVRASVGAGALALLVGGIALGQSSEPMPPEASTQPGDVPATITPDMVPATPTWIPFDGPWNTVKDTLLTGLALTPEGVVTVAGWSLFEGVTVWSSTDLTDWSASLLPGSAPLNSLPTLIEAPWGVTPIGLKSRDPAPDSLMWRMDSEGSWRKPKVFKQTVFGGGYARGDELLLAGYGFKSQEVMPAIWKTTDGDELEPVSTAGLPMRGYVSAVVETPDGGLLASIYPGPKLYLLGQGGEWVRQQLPALEGEAADIDHVTLARLPAGLVLTTSIRKQTIVWHSDAGMEWMPVAQTKGTSALVSSADQLILLPAALVSTDGVSWCQLNAPWRGGSQVTGAGALADGRFAVVGYHVKKAKNGGSTFSPVAWITEDAFACTVHVAAPVPTSPA